MMNLLIDCQVKDNELHCSLYYKGGKKINIHFIFIFHQIFSHFWLYGMPAASPLRHRSPSTLAVFCALFQRDLHLSPHSAHCGVPKPRNFHNAVGVCRGARVNTTASRSHQKLFNSNTLMLGEKSGRGRSTPHPHAHNVTFTPTSIGNEPGSYPLSSPPVHVSISEFTFHILE